MSLAENGQLTRLTLLLMGLFLTLVLMGGGLRVPPLFLFVNTIEKVIRLCTVLKKKSLSGSFEDRAIFNVSQLSYDGPITDR